MLTIKQMADKTGINYQTVAARMRKHQDLASIIRPVKPARLYVLDGVARRLSVWANWSGVPARSLRRRTIHKDHLRMSPAEHARIIEQEEFAAECAAVRQRVEQAMAAKRQEDRQRVVEWIARPVPIIVKRSRADAPPKPEATEEQKAPRKTGVPAELHTYEGVTKTRQEWAEHLGISPMAFNSRVFRYGSVEAAIEAGERRRAGRGSSSTSRDAEGTGVGSIALERDHSKKANETKFAGGEG